MTGALAQNQSTAPHPRCPGINFQSVENCRRPPVRCIYRLYFQRNNLRLCSSSFKHGCSISEQRKQAYWNYFAYCFSFLCHLHDAIFPCLRELTGKVEIMPEIVAAEILYRPGHIARQIFYRKVRAEYRPTLCACVCDLIVN